MAAGVRSGGRHSRHTPQAVTIPFCPTWRPVSSAGLDFRDQRRLGALLAYAKRISDFGRIVPSTSRLALFSRKQGWSRIPLTVGIRSG